MLQRYAELRQEVGEILGEFAGLAESLREPSLAEGARRRRERLLAGEFHIAAVSEFSNGKSTLINALLGIDLLPTHRRPLTATVIRIAYGESPEVRIAFKDGRRAVSTPNDSDLRKVLNHFCTTFTDEAKAVEDVLIRYPLSLCRHGMVLLDTPGLESVYDPHDRITRQILPAADAVLFIVEAGKIGKLADLKLVQQLRFHRKNTIFFALNKVDQLRTPEEVREAVQELRAMLKGVVDAPRIYPISALYALQARLLRAGIVTADALSRDRRLSVPEGEGFRPVRDAADAEALESLSGLPQLEAALEAYLLSAERTQEALKGGALHVTERLLETALPNLRRLRASLQKAEDPRSLEARLSRCQAELSARRAELGHLLSPGGRLEDEARAIWDRVVERRLGTPALDRIIEGIDRSLAGGGLREAGGSLAQRTWELVDYAIKRLCADAATELRDGWGGILTEMRGIGREWVQEVSARIDAHLDVDVEAFAQGTEVRRVLANRAYSVTAVEEGRRPQGAAGGISWPAAVVVGTLGSMLWKGFRAHDHLRQELRVRARQALGEAAQEARQMLGQFHNRYKAVVRQGLREDIEEDLASLELNLAHLRAALTDRENAADRLARLDEQEAAARALLERAKGVLALLERDPLQTVPRTALPAALEAAGAAEPLPPAG